MRFLFLIAFSITAFANEGDEWRKQEMSPETKSHSFIYQDSIADAIFFGSAWHLPPIQHIGEDIHGDFSAQSDALKRKIFDHLGVDGKTAKRHGVGVDRFYTGSRKNVAGRSYEYSWVNSRGSSLVTCVVVVKDNHKVHALFLESWESELPECAKKLKVLTSEAILYQ